ncbi:hypothetical protein K2173_010379 [Erythroxylum novogranatense]|uniref:DUF7054 domain-containing protein n=1 Tax=Erythroxylum novogranatense TaxID=1862640 RepID=A0AAV8TFH7_9ROSI|nr:hypothetical protein K2173_010379 [Erythroxylum novogranatense]
MLLYKQKKSQVAKGNRLFISVTVLGSAGPIRFVVNEDELVATVIDTCLKLYAREGHLPILGFDFNDFSLYCPTSGSGDLLLDVLLQSACADVVLTFPIMLLNSISVVLKEYGVFHIAVTSFTYTGTLILFLNVSIRIR